MLALSVSISTSSSPFETSSPADLSHLRIVPSSIESESRGIVTSGIARDASGPVRKYCTRFARASSPVAVSSLGHVAGPHLPHCVLATNDDPRTTSAQNLRTDPLAMGTTTIARFDPA